MYIGELGIELPKVWGWLERFGVIAVSVANDRAHLAQGLLPGRGTLGTRAPVSGPREL